MLTLDQLPHATDLLTEERFELDNGLVRVWMRTFAPDTGSAAVVLRESVNRRVSYVGRFRMFHHRYTEARARSLETRFNQAIAGHSEVEQYAVHRVEHINGWALEVSIRCELQDEAVAVMQDIVDALGLQEGLLRRAS